MRFFLFSCLILAQNVHSQNYVVNGSFEREYPRAAGLKAPILPCQFSKSADYLTTNAEGWNTFDLMTPDLLEGDSLAACTGFPQPRKGKRMVGLIMYHPFQDGKFSFDYHELIQGTFGKALEIGRNYRVSFWVRSDDSLGVRHLNEVYSQPTRIRPIRCGNFGFYFSTGPITPHENFMESQLDFAVRPQWNLEEIVDTHQEWRQYSFSFRADQPYQYFLFGNFFSDAVTKINMGDEERMQFDVQNTEPGRDFWHKTKRIGYYLFDDFRVEVDTAGPLERALRDHKVYTFSEALLFDFGKAALKSGATAELDALIRFLKNNSSLPIEIGGHTDNVGGAAANQGLSEQRALAVYTYLIDHQLPAQQLAARGYGETKPVAPNDTEANRQRNRRVEIREKAQ